MAGPWESYQDKPAAAPWEAYTEPAQPQRGVVDRLLGLSGERYQTWPERLARGLASSVYSGVTLPGDVMAGKASPYDIGRVLDLAGLGTPINPAIRAGDAAIPGIAKTLAKVEPPVPTAKELAASGGADINAATKSDLIISPSAVSDFSRLVQQKTGVHPSDAEKTFIKLRELENAPSGSYFTPSDLQAFRGSLQDTAQNFNPNAAKDQLAASRAIREFDSFLSNLSPKDTMVRPAAAQSGPATREQIVTQALDGKREADRVAGLFERGRGNYAAAQRANDITGELDRARTGLLERAEGRAQAANSGRNFDNTLRQKAEAILEKPKEISGYSDDELAALDRVVQGGPVRNTARYVSNTLGGGGGLGQSAMAAVGATAGAAVGGVPGAAIGATLPAGVGSISRSIANAIAKRDLRAVDEMMRKRSPLYQERLAASPNEAQDVAMRDAILRAIYGSSLGQRQQ
jgi:hypothetical protein